jgi:hypothetical protein
MKAPSETLAHMILEKLVAESFIIQEDVEKLLPKISTGKIKAEDWRLAIEKGSHKRVKHE